MKYRIKVETTNGGDVRYTPQFGKPKLTIGKRSVYPWLDWYNIVEEYGILNLEKGRRILYKTEEEALGIIEWYKNVVRRKQTKEIKSVEYIDVK
jgi:hypothetical protein